MKVTRADGEQTRARILDVALPLFAAHGYAGASVRTIAAAAGVNVATLAYHFVDKEGLYDTVVQRLHHDLAADAGALDLRLPAATPEELLRSWLGIGWRFVSAHRDHVRLLVRHVLDHGAQPQVVVDRWSEPLLQRAEQILGALGGRQRAPRLLILSLMHLVVRLVLEDPDQLASMSGIARDRLETDIVDWLAAVAARELGVGRGGGRE